MPKRSIDSAIWDDTWFEALDPNDKLLFFYLLTNDRTNMLGIYEVSLKKISFDTGLTIKAISKAFTSFAEREKVYYTEENYVVIKNFLKHQAFNENMKKSAIAIYESLPKAMKINDLDISELTVIQGFQTLLKEFGIFNLKEFKLKEKGNTPISDLGEFDTFWTLYPKKVSKDTCRTSWEKLGLADQKAALAGLSTFEFSEDSTYIPHPTTWLNRRRWEDEPEPESTKPKDPKDRQEHDFSKEAEMRDYEDLLRQIAKDKNRYESYKDDNELFKAEHAIHLEKEAKQEALKQPKLKEAQG